jgi:hypothetical protein
MVKGAYDGGDVLFHDMGVDLGGFNIGMAHQFLDHPDIDPVFQHVSGERMPKRVAAYGFSDTGPIYRHLYSLLQAGFKHVVPPQNITAGWLRFFAGKTYCHRNSLAADGYFLASAPGR